MLGFDMNLEGEEAFKLTQTNTIGLMIPSFSPCNLPNIIKISILQHLILLILLLLFVSLPTLQFKPINPHPVSTKIDFEETSHNQTLISNMQKKLRRLPHVFSQVLELPFRSNADVLVEERSDCFRFVAEVMHDVQVKVHTVEIHPGVTKVVVRERRRERIGVEDGKVVELMLDKLEVDVWRFRLPATTQPELAKAVVLGRRLIVTVPKRQHDVVEDDARQALGGGLGNNRLILVK